MKKETLKELGFERNEHTGEWSIYRADSDISIYLNPDCTAEDFWKAIKEDVDQQLHDREIETRESLAERS